MLSAYAAIMHNSYWGPSYPQLDGAPANISQEVRLRWCSHVLAEWTPWTDLHPGHTLRSNMRLCSKVLSSSTMRDTLSLIVVSTLSRSRTSSTVSRM